MSADARRKALEELTRAHSAVEQLDANAPEETSRGILHLWSGVESSLRTLVENDGLSGQSLIREARARQLIGFEQANPLAELDAVRERAAAAGYRPTAADVATARSAYAKLEMALRTETPVSGAPVPPSTLASPPTESSPPLQAPVLDPVAVGLRPIRPRRTPWLLRGGIAVIVVVALGMGAYFAFRGSADTKSLDEAIQFYAQGQREAAAGAFTTAARQDPKDPRPHVYLARMARESGNLTLANDELQLAIQADPKSAIALREMGAYLLAVGNNELAVKFYVHALESDATDTVAMGWLGCALTRLNRLPEAQRWVARAGNGEWSRCTSTLPSATAAGPSSP